MRIYVHDDKTSGEIARLCVAEGAEILTPEEVHKRSTMPSDVNFFLDEVDLLVVEATHPTQQVSFILAQAILAQKPTLCLYAKNQPPRQLLSMIRKRQRPRPIKTFSYTATTLAEAVHLFVTRYNPKSIERDDLPTIKYTLRLSPRIDRYLEWHAQRAKKSKADLLRALLARQAEGDTAWKKSHPDLLENEDEDRDEDSA
jgi:hypothetical protein